MNSSHGSKPILILTGASGLFGREFIKNFGESYQIIGIANNRLLPTGGNFEVFDALSGKFEDALCREINCDLSNFAEIKKVARIICGLVGTPNYLINAAANTDFICSTVDYCKHGPELIRQVFINSFAPAIIASEIFELSWKQVSPALQSASILNVSSVSGGRVFQNTNQAGYAASKAALNMLTLHMAADYMPYKIRVNAIAPDRFTTPQETKAVTQKAVQIMQASKTGQIVAC